jgi:RimJ/RimL family protein N-acetyltransferase
VSPPLPYSLEIPVIETEHLRLRGHTIEDFARTRLLWGDAAVVTFLGGKPHTLEECWTRFLRYAGHWCVLGFGYWVVEEKETRDFVGEVGFGDFKRDMEPSLGPIPELGWVLTPSAQGRGFATEAAQAALRWGQRHFDANEIACIIHPDHHASINVARKCGFEPRDLGMYKGRPAIIFKLELIRPGK